MGSLPLPPPVYTSPANLVPALVAHLPTSLPLLRRLQFRLQTASATVLTTLPPTAAPSPSPPPFAALYLDRSRAPETEAWLFSSAEAGAPVFSQAEARAPPSAADAATHRAHLLSVLAAALAQPLPAGFPQSRPGHVLKTGAVHGLALALLKGADGGAAEWARLAGLAGTQAACAAAEPSPHKHVVSLAAALAAGAAEGAVRGHTVPYVKFVRAPAALAPERAPPGLVWDAGRAADYALVVARTDIPRSAATLALMPSAVLRVEGQAQVAEWDAERVLREDACCPGRPVAWAFLGPDGSLSSLHVEEDYRGRGLAKMLARRAFAMLADGAGGAFGHDADGWGHSDVARDNPASASVARSVGAAEGWECFWAELDLQLAAEELARMGYGTDGA